MPDHTMPRIKGYHAHVYFDDQSRDDACALREKIDATFNKIAMGTFHDRLVGPHPTFSYQVAFGPALFGEIIPWLAQHRGDLRVFVHGVSNDEVYDHTQLEMWLGDSVPLVLSFFEGRKSTAKIED